MYVSHQPIIHHMHISLQLCVILIRSIVNLLALHYSPPHRSSSTRSTPIPTASSTASVSVFFYGRPGHAGEQALPGAIHIPQVSLSLWMMFLPNYLDPEPWHQPRHTHTHTECTQNPRYIPPPNYPLSFTGPQTPLTKILILADHRSEGACAPLSSSSLVLLSLFRGGEQVKV